MNGHDSHPWQGILKSMGLVFGDIGTSPIYTLTVIFLLIEPTASNVMGILSLLIWTLIILITVEYAWLAMSLSRKGEGGTIVLRELLTPYIRSRTAAAIVSVMTIIGVALLIGDGVITPAISILSAVEGIALIPGFEATAESTLILVAAAIAIGLFAVQQSGAERVAWSFGPIAGLWFLALAVSGIIGILSAPMVTLAVNPYHAARFLLVGGWPAFFLLSSIILVATGGEALYADMGHLGRKPIVNAWYLVFVALVLNYLGQGAFLLTHPDAHFILFELVRSISPLIYVPFLVLSILATVIASQAMISGLFSIVYQGITTRMLPMLRIDYTSAKLRSQIYIGSVNWLLLFAVLAVMFLFQSSARLAAAYGLAVTGTMTITGILLTAILFHRRLIIPGFIGIGVTLVDIAFLVAATSKIPAGAYVVLLIASVPLAVILIYRAGQNRVARSFRPMDLSAFLAMYRDLYREASKIRGTALFFARDTRMIPPYIALTMFTNNIIYEDNIIISIIIPDNPFGVKSGFKRSLAPGLRVFEIEIGYMEVADIKKILQDAGIQEKAIFYGLEEIVTDNIVWKIYAAVKRLAPSFVQFYKLPTDKIHGVLTRMEL
ncbi:KUP/HAK/KT family potassium transporter [Methanoculleus sp.]|uniref:KUP/HAK/KT family potassium transporter n=1 Tax=Methanoculleus sp. TaxID=90427 RepID=UPI002FCC0827